MHAWFCLPVARDWKPQGHEAKASSSLLACHLSRWRSHKNGLPTLTATCESQVWRKTWRDSTRDSRLAPSTHQYRLELGMREGWGLTGVPGGHPDQTKAPAVACKAGSQDVPGRSPRGRGVYPTRLQYPLVQISAGAGCSKGRDIAPAGL